ncbi:ammonium transporter, partial [Spiribacter halobius]
VLVVFSIVGLDKLKIDDPVGAISAHGTAGIWGLLAVPLTNPGATFGAQILGIVVIFLWVFLASLLVWGIIKAVMGIRVSEEEEFEGLDIGECGLEAYPEFTSQQLRSEPRGGSSRRAQSPSSSTAASPQPSA